MHVNAFQRSARFRRSARVASFGQALSLRQNLDAMNTHVALVLACLILGTASASAQPSFGPQLSYGTRSDLGAGVRALVPLRAPATLTAGADYFFGDERPGVDVTWVELTGGLTLPLGLDTPWEGDAYAGGAIGLSFVSETRTDTPGDGDSDVFPGVNVLAGWRSETRNFASFIEIRAVLGAARQVVFTAGLALGGGR